jgi:hypothetical protein
MGSLYPLSNTGDIKLRIARNDWADIQPANDYSYLSQPVFTSNPKVTVYYKGQLIWGTAPSVSTATAQTRQNAGTTVIQPQVSGLISIFPNPVTDILYINVPALSGQTPALSGHAMVKVTAADGRVILVKLLNRTHEELPVHDLRTGVYFVTVFNGNQAVTQKIFKE